MSEQRKVEPGELIQGADMSYWLRLVDDDRLHLYECCASLVDGSVVHVSRIPHPIKVVHGNEVMW